VQVGRGAGVTEGAAPGAAAGAHAAEGADDGRTFEQLLAELESLTDRLAGGELGIEAAAEIYERAERLHALASARLEQVRERVDRLRSPAPPPP
jgi:exodeoxyribonuclease VII small subunit